MDDNVNCASNGVNISPTSPHITIEIPESLTQDFLGVLALDVLHDAKGRGYLAGTKLSQLTDLFAIAVLLQNVNINLQETKLYIFKQVLAYFTEFWALRLDALNLYIAPDFNNTESAYWESLRTSVQLPLHHVAEREDDDAFTGLGPNKQGIETQNYLDQKGKLSFKNAEMTAFVSPQGVNKPSDYFRQASGIVDIIQTRMQNSSRIVLDMKSSAGLIRTIADPIGYITCLPTYADPGYNMPGMSAIRSYSHMAFIEEPNKDGENEHHYNGAQEFNYRIKLRTSLCDTPLTILDVRYFYGVAAEGLDRTNMMIGILDTVFHGSLPRSTTMAEALNQYLHQIPQELSMTFSDVLENVQILIWGYYTSLSQPISFLQDLSVVYTFLHKNKDINRETLRTLLLKTPYSQNANTVSTEWFMWCKEDNTIENTVFRTSYLLATLRNLHFFTVQISPHQSLLPEAMIEKVLPELLLNYIADSQSGAIPDTTILAFCFHQYKLLTSLVGRPDLTEKLNTQWLPHHKGKLCTQLQRYVQEWRGKCENIVHAEQEYLHRYVQELLQTCQENLQTVSEINEEDSNEPRMATLLNNLPVFRPSAQLQKILLEYVHFYQPELYMQTQEMLCTGLSLSALIDILLWIKEPLDLNLQQQMYAVVHPSSNEQEVEALQAVIGKHSGDLGQVMWAMCYGHIFASEDNICSSMALLLHRLPRECIQRNVADKNPVWANIHGLGDGGNVDVIIDRE